MSTWLYLECRTHDPVLTSEGDVGQHLYDLPQIRAMIHGGPIPASRSEEWLPGSGYFWRNASRFLDQHPKCEIGIRDEYGNDHPVEVEEGA